jgi:hypothetical protein
MYPLLPARIELGVSEGGGNEPFFIARMVFPSGTMYRDILVAFRSFDMQYTLSLPLWAQRHLVFDFTIDESRDTP